MELGAGGEVVQQFNSSDLTDSEFISLVAKTGNDVEFVVCEDLPHNLGRFDSGMKRVCRLQGRLVHHLDVFGLLPKLVFLPPATWQRFYPGVWRQGVTGAATAARKLGYVAPNYLLDWEMSGRLPSTGPERQKVREQAKKMMSDHTDAFLIAHYSQGKLKEYASMLDVPTTSGY